MKMISMVVFLLQQKKYVCSLSGIRICGGEAAVFWTTDEEYGSVPASLMIFEMGDHFKLKQCSSTYPSCSKSNPSQPKKKTISIHCVIYLLYKNCILNVTFWCIMELKRCRLKHKDMLIFYTCFLSFFSESEPRGSHTVHRGLVNWCMTVNGNTRCYGVKP